MSKTLIYAGIGSRETPAPVLVQMTQLACELADKWTLRSGHAEGADMAFEEGCIAARGKKEIFLPWYGFNGAPNHHPDYLRPAATEDLAEFASSFHPAWNKCSDPAKLMHMRNCCQILGLYGDSAVSMVICWTPHGKRGGGTGQALRIAEHFHIPIFDLALPDTGKRLCEFVNKIEALSV